MRLDFATMVDVLDWQSYSIYEQEHGDLIGELVTQRLEAFEAEHGEDLIAHCSRMHDCQSLSWPKDFPLGSETLNGTPLTLDAVREVKRQWRSILKESMQTARALLRHAETDAQAARERFLFDTVAREFGQTHRVEHHGRPEWLERQHLDVWFPDSNLAIEFQGLQHFMPVDHFGGEMRFRDQYDRDLKKRRLCEDHECRLLIVDEEYDREALLERLRTLLSSEKEHDSAPVILLLGQQSNSMLAAREALYSGSSLEFDYLAQDGSASHRVVVPIAFQMHLSPCLRAYCTLRESERSFSFKAMSNVRLCTAGIEDSDALPHQPTSHPAPSRFEIELMRHEASIRLADSEDLGSRAHRQSDSGYLLELLALEILLKALFRVYVGEPSNSHKYDELYGEIPGPIRARVEASARRARPTGNYDAVPTVLKYLGENFVKLRYPYEKYRGMSEAAYLERGEAWIAHGALSGDADYLYYPAELNGLTQGLLSQIDAWLAAAV